MKQVEYWLKADRLIYLDEKATPEFWDAHWDAEGGPPSLGPRHEVVRVTKKYLARGARILEGGCGRANKVKALADAGYNAIGIDFAGETVKRARLDYPNIDIRKGDVRSLEFSDCCFDGYWSFGVIEHFWGGYQSILSEAARVLKPDGLLFLTAPWFSPYRKRKARYDGYPRVDPTDEPEFFYQFALSRLEVCEQLRNHGFEVEDWRGRASAISMRDDMQMLRGQIDWLLGSRGSILKRVLRRAITKGLNPYCGHSFLAVARRKAATTSS